MKRLLHLSKPVSNNILHYQIAVVISHVSLHCFPLFKIGTIINIFNYLQLLGKQ